MASSGDNYVVARQNKIKRRQRFLTWVSIISFSSSGVFAAIPTIKQAFWPSQQSAKVSAESTLRQQAKGYELVLQREPNNLVALEGLVHVRLQLGDVRGAIPPLEKLVKQDPGNQEYRGLLEKLKNP